MFGTLISKLFSVVAFALGFADQSSIGTLSSEPPTTCDGVQHGYHCRPEMTHHWGQYSPWFSVPSEIPADIPRQCTVSFAQILSRHGARYPTEPKVKDYNTTIHKIKQNVHRYRDQYAFLRSYQYYADKEQLTEFGKQELVNSGLHFFRRYAQLSTESTPFVRASSQQRVLESAQKWSEGFHLAKLQASIIDPDYPYYQVNISEAPGSNNTLNHDLCTAFEDGMHKDTASLAQREWAAVFLPAIKERLNQDLLAANITDDDTVRMMDLCPYETIASSTGAISPFCDLFTLDEWRQYGYYQSLNKYYGMGMGNLLGPTQGVGFVNELIARLTNTTAIDHTSTNHTLNNDPTQFPVGRTLYADFSHDNDMTAIFFAMGFYNSTQPLSNTTLETVSQTNGFSAAYTVPFAARMYVEKLQCKDSPAEEMVRVIVNDRVIPLETCGGDALGRCSLSNFVNSLTFAAQGGHWDMCFS